MSICVRLGALVFLLGSILLAAEYQGQVTFGGLPVPGATVTATRHDTQSTAITDVNGLFSFPDLTNEPCTIEIQMLGFATVKLEVAAGATAPTQWELKLLPLDQINAGIESSAPLPVTAEQTKPPDQSSAAADDGFLINGSMLNGASSPFAQLSAFGNNRTNSKGLYNGGIGVTLDNSALDARPFSLTGQNTPKASYNRLTAMAAVGGPLKIPHLFKRPPNFFAAYQWTRNNNSTVQTGLVPDLAQRGGTYSPGNTIPASQLSPQARVLLSYYPVPNFNGSAGYNYQIPILSPMHQDALQSRWNKSLGPSDEIYSRFALQSQRSDTSNLFGFRDTTDSLGIDTSINWWHRLSSRWFLTLGYQFSRLATRVAPYFENRDNVSAAAGISGNNQEPANWGPPSLIFSSGIAGLSDVQSSHNRNQTSGVSDSLLWNRGSHNVTLGADFRRQQFNYLSQQDPRGTFTFTGSVTGSDFGDFLLGIPDTSSIAFGNSDKYFRESVYDIFLTDDWRISPELTVNAGARWEYGAPITEVYGRLVNLNIAPGFTAVSPVVAATPGGYPVSLVRPDKRGIEPRIGIAWRPVSGSSMVVRAGYGIYRDTSVYQTIALQMAQQPPLSKSLRVENSPADPLTLANGFVPSPLITGNTFAIDPNFRVGYAQNWQLSIQRDLPASLQLTATYLGIKGTRGPQEFLPNTFPNGAPNPCPACPSGFAYLTSGGNSTRESGQLQVRRRLHNGLTGTLQYTYSKSIDDDAFLGGQGGPSAASPPLAIAQNWLDLSAERSLSTFDQRHLLNLQMQYTIGMGIGGGTLLSGWKGALFKEWTVGSTITAGSGLPQTPIYLTPVQGTGVTGTIRPDYIGGPALDPASYLAPLLGQWGNAGRNTITGPAQFSWNASLGRVFRMTDRLNLDLRVDSTNALNHVTYTVWNTTVNSPQFGLPAASNAMRSMQVTLRLRF